MSDPDQITVTLSREEAREICALWVCHGMRPPEIDEAHPAYTGPQKICAVQVADNPQPSDTGRYEEALRELLKVVSDISFEAEAEIPAHWPSVSCKNIGHGQRHEDDWRCPDCCSTWWAINETEPTAASDIEAFIFAALQPAGEKHGN